MIAFNHRPFLGIKANGHKLAVKKLRVTASNETELREKLSMEVRDTMTRSLSNMTRSLSNPAKSGHKIWPLLSFEA